MSILICVPVLDRPTRALPLARSLAEATEVEYRLMFVCTDGDKAEIAACREAIREVGNGVVEIAPFPLAPGDFQRKTNYAVSISDEEWILCGADDLFFHPKWDVLALSIGRATHKRVIGTNDLGNPNVMRVLIATHPLVARSYVEEHGTIDEPGKLYCELYSHNWCDVEFCETAQFRKEWVFARRSHVEHLHPVWRGRDNVPKGLDDATYERGQRDFFADRDLLDSRRPLWGKRPRHRRNVRSRRPRTAR